MHGGGSGEAVVCFGSAAADFYGVACGGNGSEHIFVGCVVPYGEDKVLLVQEPFLGNVTLTDVQVMYFQCFIAVYNAKLFVSCNGS